VEEHLGSRSFRFLLLAGLSASGPALAQVQPPPPPAPPPVAAEEFEDDLQSAAEGSWEVYGFAQFDMITDMGGRMNPDWVDAFRPSRIATPEGEFGPNGDTSLSVKQSRLGLIGKTDIGKLQFEGKFEFDLFGVGDNAGKTYFRLRHAYASLGPVLVGQTNSLFMDGGIFPNVIDYWGPAGMVFLRTPQVRLTAFDRNGLRLAFAVEKVADDIDPGGLRFIVPDIGANIVGKTNTPNVTMQARYEKDWGHVQLAGIVRALAYETEGTPDNAPSGNLTGWGINATGTYRLFPKVNFLGGVVYGRGIASLMNDGGMDVAPTAQLAPPMPVPPIAGIRPPVGLLVEAEAVPLLGISTYFDVYWTKAFSSSFGYSQTSVDNTNFQTPDTFRKGQYASTNFLWTPLPRILTGAEFLWGQRTDRDGTTGQDYRVQLSFKFSFSSNQLRGN
jgi:hypothetical protein